MNVAHLAAAPMGSNVTFRAEVTKVTDKRLEFRVEAWDETEKIGEGTHERAIINVARFATRMAAKRSKARPLEQWWERGARVRPPAG